MMKYTGRGMAVLNTKTYAISDGTVYEFQRFFLISVDRD
jgi:hypothetical protein